MEMIDARELVYSYDLEGSERRSLDGISLTVNKGELVAVLGHNGCGKTTLARHLNALLPMQGGELTVAGCNARDENRVWQIRKSCGMVFQNPDNQFVSSYVEEDIAFGPRNFGADEEDIPEKVKAALEAVTTGEKGILIAGVDYNAYSSMAKGEPLNIYYPASGTVVNPRPAMILKTAPNMDNAKAFVDFLFSDEAQQLVADAYLLPGRSDVQCENRTNLSDIPQITTDWTKMMEVASDTAAKLNSLCK